MKKLFTFCLALLTSVSLMAQNAVLNGEVKDVGGEALIGANVVLKGTTIGTVTDGLGEFSLTVPTGQQTIIVSYTGYSSEEVSINVTNGTNQVSVELTSGALIDPVVVSGSKKPE